jgi:hypothetical protein
VTISERIQTARRERRVLRVSRAGWRLEQAERERTWALVPARAEGISIRTLATAVGLSPSRVHQLVAAADLDGSCRQVMKTYFIVAITTLNGNSNPHSNVSCCVMLKSGTCLLLRHLLLVRLGLSR